MRWPAVVLYVFWGLVNAENRLDLLLVNGEVKTGFEIKYTSRPTTTKSMHVACESLQLDKLYVVYPGEHNFPLTNQIEAVSLHKAKDVVGHAHIPGQKC